MKKNDRNGGSAIGEQAEWRQVLQKILTILLAWHFAHHFSSLYAQLINEQWPNTSHIVASCGQTL